MPSPRISKRVLVKKVIAPCKKLKASNPPRQDNIHILKEYGKENEIIFSRADDEEMDLDANDTMPPFSPHKSNNNYNYSVSGSGRISYRSSAIHSNTKLSSSIYHNPCLAYYNALDEDKQHRWYLTPDRWLLLRAHLPRKPSKLSYTNYWIINCVDKSMESLQCSCKASMCIHVSYILANLKEISESFPDPISYEDDDYQLNSSTDLSNIQLEDAEDVNQLALMEINPSRLHVEVLREMPDNHFMRRLFVVFRIYKTYNTHTGTQPVTVLQRNILPLENSFWCRHCSVFRCIHIAACIKYCNKYPILKLTKYISTRHPRSLDRSVSWNPVPLPNFLQAMINSGRKKCNVDNKNGNTSIGQSTLSYIPTEIKLQTQYSELYSKRCSNKDCPSPLQYVLVNRESSLIYGKECVYQGIVYDIHCRCCNQISSYDGLEDGIFNYNGKILFTHSLLNFYTTAYSVTSYPFNAFVLTMNRIYTERGLGLTFVSRPTFLTAWCRFVKLQQWEYKFVCPICGYDPEIIFCDGTSVSIQKIYADSLRSPIDVDKDLPLRESTYLSSTENTCYNSNVITIIEDMIKSAKQKNIPLCKSISEQYLVYLNTTIKPNHSVLEFKHYFRLYRYFGLICVNLQHEKTFIEQSEKRKILITVSRLKLALRLLSILSAKHESLVGLITPEVLGNYKIIISAVKLNETKSHQVLNAKHQLSELRPILHDCLKAFNLFDIEDQYDSKSFKATDSYTLLRFLDSIMEKAESIHKLYDERQAKVGARLESDSHHPVINDLEYYKATGSIGKFYSTRASYRKLQRYKIVDKIENSSNKLHLDCIELCNKQFDVKRKYTGGIMCFWCEHGISYGFHMIQQSEALRDILSALLIHWSKSPKIIIYDNACHLMKYCHSREWDYFKNTTFLIDEFHQYNHTNCSEVHSMKAYKLSRGVKYLFKNDSVAESGNSGLIKIKPSMNFLQADAAFTYTLIQLELQNIVKTNLLLQKNTHHSSFTAKLNKTEVSCSPSDVEHILPQDSEQEEADDNDSDSELELQDRIIEDLE
jgi:hypothetical protein